MGFLDFIFEFIKYCTVILTVMGGIDLLFVIITIGRALDTQLSASYLKYFKQYAVHDDHIRKEFLLLSPEGELRATVSRKPKKLELLRYNKFRLKYEDGQETKTVDTTYYAKYKPWNQTIDVNHIEYLHETPFLIMNKSMILTNPRIVSYESLSTNYSKYVKHNYVVEFDAVVFDFSSSYTSPTRRTFTIIAKEGKHDRIDKITFLNDKLEGYNLVTTHN